MLEKYNWRRFLAHTLLTWNRKSRKPDIGGKNVVLSSTNLFLGHHVDVCNKPICVQI